MEPHVCLHLFTHCCVLDCLRGIFETRRQGVLPGVVDPSLMDLVLSACLCAAMISASALSLSPAFPSHWQDFRDINHFCNLLMVQTGQGIVLP